ncbi:MAG: PAS domain S-box protein, partial [Acidobacteriota bacterium]
MQDTATPQQRPWKDPWVLGSLGAALLGAAAALPLSAHPPRALLEVVALPLLMAVFLYRVDQLDTPREQAFWIRMGWGFFFLWLAALFALSPLRGALPAPGLDALRLLGLMPIALALDLRPHRQAQGPPQLLRQLQLTAVFLTTTLLLFYVHLGPLWSRSGEVMSAPKWATSELFFAILFAMLSLRRRATRWRLLYAAGAAYFGLRIWAALQPTAVAPFLAVAGAAVLWVRLRHRPFEGDINDPPRPRFLHLEVPVVAMLPILPSIHLCLTALGFLPAEGESLRQWLALASIALLAPIAWIEYLILQRRRSHLELEHRRAAEATVERSVYLDSLIEHSPLAIVVLDPQHRVQVINPAFERLFGYSSEDMVDSTLDLLISTDQRRSEASGYTRSVIEGRSVHVTTRRSRRDGTEVDVEIYGVPLMRDGELIGLFAIYQDVSDRVRAERDRKESEERFRRLSDASFEGIVVSSEGRIIDCNEQYARMVGVEVQSLVGRKVLDFVTPADRDLVESRIRRGLEQPYEHRVKRADGGQIVVQVHARAMPSEGRQMRVAAVRDITEQKRFQAEVRQSQKMEAVGRLAGGIAHDFNNLLTVIKGYAQLLSMQMEQGKPRSLVEEILQASERASLMTQRLLAFGRKQAVQPQNLDLNEVIGGMEKILRRLVRADIAFDFRLQPELGQVKADLSQIEQVILNLAINAGDAMPNGGQLRLETAEVEVAPDDVKGPLTAPGSFVVLSVTDTGLGMDPETLQQVFEPFFTTKEKGKGTGLGLATVYAIVKQSGGTIDVQSEPGAGTTFRIDLPKILETAAKPAEEAAAPALPRGQET